MLMKDMSFLEVEVFLNLLLIGRQTFAIWSGNVFHTLAVLECVQKRQNLGLIHDQKNPRFRQKMAYGI